MFVFGVMMLSLSTTFYQILLSQYRYGQWHTVCAELNSRRNIVHDEGWRQRCVLPVRAWVSINCILPGP